jgi:hypothetical protein
MEADKFQHGISPFHPLRPCIRLLPWCIGDTSNKNIHELRGGYLAVARSGLPKQDNRDEDFEYPQIYT